LPAVTRVPVDYTFPEPFGHAEVSYCFEVSRLAQLESGHVVTVERLQPGMRFILDDGSVATVTAVGTPEVWEPPPSEPNEDGNYLRRVLGRIKRTGFVVLDLFFGDQTITTTPGHLFYSLDRKGWAGAVELRIGESLQSDKGERLRLDGKSRVRHGLIELYNVEVEQLHTYFVGRERGNSALVHNGVGGPGGPGCPIPGPANPGGSVPRLTPGQPRQMLGEAIKQVKSLPRDAAARADAFEALAKQIESQSGGAWSAARGTGTDGSIIFLGRQGEGLVVTPDGRIFRGAIGRGIDITPNGLQPNVGSLTPLD
jgi:hypothetical protein